MKILVFCSLIVIPLLVFANLNEPPFKVRPEIGEELKKQDYKKAEEILLREEPENTNALAWIKHGQGKSSEAVALVLDSVDRTNSDSVLKAAVLLKSMGATAEAANLLEVETSVQSKANPEALVLLAESQPDLSRRIEIVERLYEQSYKSDSFLRLFYSVIAQMYSEGKSIEALELYSKYFKLNPDAILDPGHMLQWAHIATKANRPLEAISKIDKIKSTHPDYYAKNRVLISIAKGNAFIELRDFQQAEQEFIALINNLKKSPDDPFYAYLVHAELGLEKVKKYQEAIRSSQKFEPPKREVRNRNTYILVMIIAGSVLLGFVVIFKVWSLYAKR